MIERIQGQWDDTDDLARTFKEFVDEKDLFSDDIKNPESESSKRIYESIKEMRMSNIVNDPFTKNFKGKVLEQLLSDPQIFAFFIHWATRNDKKALDSDEITDGYSGLDLEEKDVISFILEHYGEDEDTSRVKTKFKGALRLLKEKVGKDDEFLEIEKAALHFLVPNKPMYRIFDIDDIKELKGFTGEWLVQEKYDGMRIQIHKIDNKVKIYSYNEKDITKECPEQVKVMENKHFGECILDGELMLFDGDEPLHRAEVVSRIFKDKKSNAELRAHVFDIMRHDDDDTTATPLRERIAILFNNYSQHSEEKLAFPSKKDTKIADNLSDVEKYSKEIMEIPTAEGVVLKDIESTYFVGTKKNPKWIKWKKFVDLDLIVLEKSKTKSDMFSYTLGAGPLSEKEAESYDSNEIEGNNYINVGKSLNTKIDVKVGSIVRVKVDEVKESNKSFRLFNSKIIEIPEVEHPDKLITLKLLSADTKKSISYNVKALEKGIHITDNVHGDAILKFDLDGFPQYNLMAKNAILDIDEWKSQVTDVHKALKGELRSGIINLLKKHGELTINEIANHIDKNSKLESLYKELFKSDIKLLRRYMINQAMDYFDYDDKSKKFDAKEDIIEKYKTPDDLREGIFKLYEREDGNLQFLIKLSDKLLAWTIKINSMDDVFNLFGKSKKFPSRVETNISKEKLIDEGDIELGVQRDGYHEYLLSGNKFESKLHLRVVPYKDGEYWVAFTGVETKRVDEESDEGLWNITEDKYKDLDFSGLD